MYAIDWLIVLALNGAVIAAGLWLARGTKTSGDWFLARRALPWWAVGLSMFATNVDNADIVGVTGQTYNEGLHVITVYAIGSAVGGILAAFYIVPAIAKHGFFTNAEYLEARFGPTMRVLSALIQLQYRSSMLGMMIWSVYLLLTRLVGVEGWLAWALIVVMVVLAGLYTAWGGLKSVVWTDAAQGVIMMVAALVIFFAVFYQVGGWKGMSDKLARAEIERQQEAVEEQEKNGEKPQERPQPLTDLPHIGRYFAGIDRDEPFSQFMPLLVVLGWTIIGSGYWTVNHTQTMRLMGTRSLWDMKMAALFGVALSLPVMIFVACIGVFARALPEYANLQKPDTLFPRLANDLLAPGFKGLVVAGAVAAAVSTFDSMGSALSAIFTRDIYARLIVRNRPDAHYMLVGRLATVGVLCLGFLYLPFILLQENMLKAFTTLIPVFVTPLFTVYVVGVLVPVHRRSGLIGLLVGSVFGVIALIDREVIDPGRLPVAEAFEGLPWWLTKRWPALCWSVLITSTTMIAVTLILGRQREEKLPKSEETGWLGRSREQFPPLPEHPFKKSPGHALRPFWWAMLLFAICLWIVFDVFW